MNVKCRCCGKKLNKKDGIRLPVKFSWDENLEGSFYYCSPKCLGDDLCIKVDTIINLDLSDEQLNKIADILAD